MRTLSLFSYLHTSSQHGMKHVSSFLHESDVLRCGICTLAVLDGVDEAVPELAKRAQKVVLNEIGHAVILGERKHKPFQTSQLK